MIKLADGRENLWQWDTGRSVTVDEPCTQAHFANKTYGRSYDVDIKDGAAIIPDILLQSCGVLKCWAFVAEENNGYTKIEKEFTVNKRNKPNDYLFTEIEQQSMTNLQRQIGNLNELKTTNKNNLVEAINEARDGGGGGSSDFLIDMTVEQNEDGTFKATCDATFEQIDAAVSAGIRVVVIASENGTKYELPLILGVQGREYYFGAFVLGQSFVAYVSKMSNISAWAFFAEKITADSIYYENDALAGVWTVKEALDKLAEKAHNHSNKDVLDKLSTSDGKLQYDGSDVGLKGDKGADGKTPVKGTDYWTAADKAEIVADTLAALPTWTGGSY